MDKFKTIGVGGLPHTLNDFRQFLGRLDAPSEGIYQAFNNLLRGIGGDDFIVQGCVVSGSTGAFSITEGWIILSGELIKVDAQGPFDEAADGTFTKVTTFDSRGTKTFLNGSINETYEKNRGVISGLAGSLAFDGDPLTDIVGLGAWIDEPFLLANFASNTGTWTLTDGNVDIRSKAIGKTMTVSIEIATSSLAGGPASFLTMVIPQSKTFTNDMTSLGVLIEGGTTQVLQMGLTGGNKIFFQPLDGSTIGNGTVIIKAVFIFEID